MKAFLNLLLLATCSLVFYACKFESATNDVVMRVQERELTSKKFSESLAARLRKYDALSVKSADVIETTKNAILDEFLQQSVLVLWAEKKGLKNTSEEITALANKFRSQYPDDVTFRESLAIEGLAYDDWYEDLGRLALQEKLFNSLRASIQKPTTEEMKSYYEMNKDVFYRKASIRIRQIVFAKQDDAERVLEQLKKGTDLAPLAKQFSIAPEGANGGDTGWIPKGTLEIFDKAFDWPVGKRSAVLKTDYGFHIIEVLGKRPEAQLKFEESTATIEKLMLADREQAAYVAWLEEQIRIVHVYKNDALINAISVTTKGGN